MQQSRHRLAKLTRPRPSRIVERERLFAVLSEARRDWRGICIAGPPGAGKTTLVTSYLDAGNVDGIWYQIDAGDADVASFFHYLGTAALPFTRKKQRPLPPLRNENLADLAGFTRSFCRELFGRLPEGSVLVFDDYQELPADHLLHQLLAHAVHEIPAGINLILISRRDLPDFYARLIANDQVGCIAPDALKLDLKEAAAIALTRLQAAVADVAPLHELSGGWAAGYTLILERWRQGARMIAMEPSESLSAVFDYFSGQLFDGISASSQRLLLALSYLPQMSVTGARSITGSSEAISLLENMHQRNLFTMRAQTIEVTYQFHALLRSFLQDRARRTLDLVEQRNVTLGAARVLEAGGQLADAVSMYLAGADPQSVRTLILREARSLIGQGRWRLLAEWIERLPQQLLYGDCWLLHWLGSAEIAAYPSKARERLIESFALARRCEDRLCQAQAAAGVIESYMVEYTHFQPLDRWVAEISDLIAAGVEFGEVEIELRVQSALLIGLAVRRPDSPRLAPCVERVFELLQTDTDVNLRALAAAHVFRYGATTGPIAIARRAAGLLESLLALPEVAELNAVVGLAAMTGFYSMTGNRPACLKACARIDRIAEDQGLPFLTKLALINRMWLELFAMDLPEARRLLAELERVIDVTHPFDFATIQGAKAWFALLDDKVELAISLELQAIEFFDKAGPMMHRVNFRIGMVVAHFKQHQFDAARDWIGQMREIARDGLTPWQRCSLSLWEANIACEEGRIDLMHGKLREALIVAQSEDSDFIFFNWTRPWMPRLCEEALSARIEVPYVRELIRKHRVAPPSPATPHWPWPARVHTLGTFELFRNDEPIRFGRKAPRRILALLKYLIANGGDEISVQRLVDTLWSDQEGDAAVRALGVALARLRNLMGNHDMICVNGERVSINSDLVWTDLRAFDLLTAQIDSKSTVTRETAADAATRLLSLYHGEFLACDPDEPWALRPRLRLRAKFIRCLAVIGGHLERAEHWNLAIDCYRRGLEVDDLAEELYQGLMRCYAGLAEPAKGLAAFRRMMQALSTGLGVRPSPASETLAADLQKLGQAGN